MTRSGITGALEAFESPTLDVDCRLGAKFIADSLDAAGRVRFTTPAAFDEFIRGQFEFELWANDKEPTKAESRQIFYRCRMVLVRFKTRGTASHAAPHMVVTLFVGDDRRNFDNEIGKFSRHGQLIPKLGPVGLIRVQKGPGGEIKPDNPRFPRLAAKNDWRSLTKLGKTYDEIVAVDDAWAEECHLDFVEEFQPDGDMLVGT